MEAEEDATAESVYDLADASEVDDAVEISEFKLAVAWASFKSEYAFASARMVVRDISVAEPSLSRRTITTS
jgi:hypothetical protein